MPTSSFRSALLCWLMYEAAVHHARALTLTVCNILCTVLLMKKMKRHSLGCILAALGHWQCRDELLISTCACVSFNLNVLQKHH